MNILEAISKSNRVALAVVITAILGICILFCGCNNEESNKANDSGVRQFETHQESRNLMGDLEPCDVRVGLIMGPPSMGLSQFMIASDEGATTNNYDFTVIGVDYVGLAAALNQGDYDIATLPSNIGPVLFNNKELKQRYQVISVNNLDTLYSLTTDESVQTIDDLKGRTIYSFGEAGTPEYIMHTLFSKCGIVDDINIEFKSSPFEVLNLLQSEPNAIAVLPQPFATVAGTMVDDLKTPIDFCAEWKKAFADTESQIVTTVTIANREFVESHEQAIIEYLIRAGMSVDWTVNNPDKAGALQQDLGTFMNNEAAVEAIPKMSIVCLTGETMRDMYSGYLEELYRLDPSSIGGELPDDSYYYLPPIDSIPEEYLQAGLSSAFTS